MSLSNCVCELAKLKTDDLTEEKVIELLDKLCSFYLGVADKSVLERFPEDQVQILGTLIIRAAITGISEEELNKMLPVSVFQKPVLEALKKNGNSLKAGPLNTIGWKYPLFVGVDWKIDEETDSHMADKEPLAELTFSHIPTGQTNAEAFSFSCTKKQLQDMQWKVKEAYNFLQKMTDQ